MTDTFEPSPTEPASPAYDGEYAKPEPTDYFKTFRSLKAGEKLQLLSKLNVKEVDLGQIGTAQFIAVAWKHRKSTTGQAKINDLLEMTEEELFEVAGLTEEDFNAQVEAVVASKSDD